MDANQKKLFREYETELDEYHKSLPLWGRSRPEAICAIMSIADAVWLGYLQSPHPPNAVSFDAQAFQGMEDGVSHALRWLTSDGNTVVRSVRDHDLITEAYYFARHASDYANIADFHVTYRRGWATVQVDGASRTVTFEPIQGPGPSDGLVWNEHVREQSDQGMKSALSMNPSDIQLMRTALLGVDHRLEDGRILLGDLPQNIAAICRSTMKKARDVEFMPLPPESDLRGFTMAEFWSFFEVLYGWSFAVIMRCMRYVESGIHHFDCLATQILQEDQFIDRVMALSHLERDAVRAILDRLIFCSGPKADIGLTPFLRSEGNICWSPAVIMKYRHERNLLKVMSRGTKELSDHAATLNGRRCRVLGGLIGMVFQKRGYDFTLDTPVTANDENTDVDVLLYQTKTPEEVLIVEAKALIGPDDVNEVYDSTQVLIAGQDQVRCAKRILSAMSNLEKQEKFRFVNWEKVSRIYGVVVSSYAWPREVMDLTEVPVLTYGTLKQRFRSQDFRRPSRFFAACAHRLWKHEEMAEARRCHHTVKVGNLTYRLPAEAVEIKEDNR